MSYYFRWYDTLLLKRPLVSRMITSGALFGLGDFLSQYITFKQDVKAKEESKNYKFTFDLRRSLTFMTFGCFMASPLLYFHYGRFLPWVTSRTDLTGTLIKVGVD